MEYLKEFLDSMTGFEQNPTPPNIVEPFFQEEQRNNTNPCLVFLENAANAKIQKYQLVLKDIQVCDDLHKFGNLGSFDRSFMEDLEWLRDTWLDDESEELFDAKKVGNIEDQLVALPFETALIHTNPLYRTSSLEEIWLDVFKESAEWRMDPSLVMTMSKEDKLRIYKHFEYMCYFVINTREALLFDIKTDLGCE